MIARQPETISPTRFAAYQLAATGPNVPKNIPLNSRNCLRAKRPLRLFSTAEPLITFADDPIPFFKRLALGAAAFISSLPDTMLKGYLHVTSPCLVLDSILLSVCRVWPYLCLLMRSEKAECEFWAPLFVGCDRISCGRIF